MPGRNSGHCFATDTGCSQEVKTRLEEVGMSQKQHKIAILSILSENLDNPSPELFPTIMIENQMDISGKVLRQTLKSMQGMGVIQTDPDLRFNLITKEGITWLSMHKLDQL